MIDNILKLKPLLGIKEDDKSKDLILEFILEDVRETILNYCNIKEVPLGLNSIMFKMAVDLYRYENLGSEVNSLGVISSIKEGDTSVSYTNTISDFKDSILKDYKAILNRYRKLVW